MDSLDGESMENGVAEEAEIRILVEAWNDVVEARGNVRAFAARVGFKPGEATIMATLVSDLARQILRNEGRGEIVVTAVNHASRYGASVTVRHELSPAADPFSNPVQDVVLVGPTERWRSIEGLRRLIDRFELVSDVENGMTITVRIRNA